MYTTTLFITQTNQLVLQLNSTTPTWAYFDSPTGQIVVAHSPPSLGLSTAYSTTLPNLLPSTTPQSILNALYASPSYADFKALLSSGVYPPVRQSAPKLNPLLPNHQLSRPTQHSRHSS